MVRGHFHVSHSVSTLTRQAKRVTTRFIFRLCLPGLRFCARWTTAILGQVKMASALYSKGREGFLDGSIDWNTGTIKVSLLRGYTFNDAHQFLSDITSSGATIVATQTLTT